MIRSPSSDPHLELAFFKVLVLTPEEVLEDQKSIHDPRAKTIQFPLRNALRSKLDMSISSMMASESFDDVLIYYYKRKKSFQCPVN